MTGPDGLSPQPERETKGLKKEDATQRHPPFLMGFRSAVLRPSVAEYQPVGSGIDAVSYTHLTLPTT